MTIKSFFLKPLYPFLLTLFFVLHGFAENFFLIEAKDMLLLLLVYLAGCGILFFLSWLFFRNAWKAAFFTFLLLSFNYFFGYVHDMLKSVFPDSFLVKYSVILSAAFIFFLVLAIVLKKKTFTRGKLGLYLNLLFTIFILIDIAVITKKSISLFYRKEERITLSCTTALPDVYLIITDEYGGSKGLSEVCTFDNSPFLDSLQQRGFFVAHNSRSNYNYTTFSMASLLRMDYLPLKGQQLSRLSDATPVLNLIFNNKVTSFFKKAGYTIYNYSSFDISDQPAQLGNKFIPSRTKLFTSQTLIDRIQRDSWVHIAGWLNLRGVLKGFAFQNRNYNQQIYEQSLKTAQSVDTTHKFVYTHLEFPHYPYYYDEKGNPYTFEEMEADHGPGNQEHYIAYIKYANNKLLHLVDEILHKNRTPPIIVLMSDHGYRCYPGDSVFYTFRNLMTVYLPDKNYARFNDSLTNVNLFRTVLNTSFCQQLPLLRDTTISNFPW